MSHAFVTLAIPFPPQRKEDVCTLLSELGNPIGEPTPPMGSASQDDPDDLLLPKGERLRKALDEHGQIHFMSAAIAPGEPGEDDHLVFEINADCPKEEVLALFDPDTAKGKEIGDVFRAVLAKVGIKHSPQAFLASHMLSTGSGYFKQAGLDFCGTPGLSVQRIRAEARLGNWIRDRLGEDDAFGVSQADKAPRTSLARLNWLRDEIREETNDAPDRKLIDATEPVPMLVEQKIEKLNLKLGFDLFIGATKQFLWPLLLLAAGIALWRSQPFLFHHDHTHLGSLFAWLAAIWSFFWRGLAWSALFVIIAWIGIALCVRSREAAEEPDNTHPDPDRLNAVRAHEDRLGIQNHLFGVSRMKPGFLRGLLLRFAFWLIGYTARHVYRPGHLRDIGTIHFARWFRIPKTRTLIFCSNYGGSWESYLEDFITKAPNGLTAVWSNTVGFPMTKFLFGMGARQSDPFKRWARRQQHPTLLHYSAYPKLSTDRIRINAAIRNGLVSAVTEDEARAVLSLLGSRPAPADTLEKDEIQTLILSGMSHYKQSAVNVITLPGSADNPNPEQAAKCRDILADMVKKVGHGERPGGTQVDQIAFSATGLAKLGRRDLIADFPYPFRAGMAARAAALGDTGEDAPENWEWGSEKEAGDVVLISYLAETPPPPNPKLQEPDYKQASQKHRETEPVRMATASNDDDPKMRLRRRAEKISEDLKSNVTKAGGSVSASIVTLHLDNKERKENGWPHAREFFGFADGISQPRIRGLRPYRLINDDQHILAPGEFVLGYPDNREQRAYPSTVPAHMDPNNVLPVAGADHGQAIEPDLAKSGINELRDFGRNGTFIVVRQLAQEVEEFEETLTKAERVFASHPGMPTDLRGKRSDQLEGLSDVDLKKEIEKVGRRKHFIGAKMVGRWRDGSSLVTFPNEPRSGWDATDAEELQKFKYNPSQEDDAKEEEDKQHRGDNGFLFGRDDPIGLACPFGSHIRRTNPRDSLKPNSPEQVDISNRHRILRRGRFFITNDKAKNANKTEGLMFICANADIERQFEFIQQTWMMAPQFHGLHDEVDPLFARSREHTRGVPKDAAEDAEPKDRFTIPTNHGPMVVTGIQDSIRVVGGGYFFAPSRAALRFLIDGAKDPNRDG